MRTQPVLGALENRRQRLQRRSRTRRAARSPSPGSAAANRGWGVWVRSIPYPPDRLIVGEARGPELLDMLLAANTGHDGSVTTLHANGVADVPARIEALATLAGVERQAAHSLLASALSVAVHLQRAGDGRRRVTEIAVLVRDPAAGLVAAEPALLWSGELQVEPGARRLRQLLESRGVAAPMVLCE
jgi:hypothetical protein